MQMQIDFMQAEINRDNGMLVSSLNANAHYDDWTNKAYNYLLLFIRFNGRISFMAEDIREFATNNGFEEPPSKRAWGSVILRAAKEGIIKKIGYDFTRNPKAHRTPATKWIVS